MNKLIIKNHFALADKILEWNALIKSIAPKGADKIDLTGKNPKEVTNNIKEIKSFCLILLRQIENIEIKLNNDLHTRGRTKD